VVDVDTDEVKIGGVADFDYDAETQIRWRGLGHGRGLGACCYIDPDDPDLATTICADGMTRGACNILDGDFAPNMLCTDDPCPGACCEDDGAGNFICEDLNQSDCDFVGGVFKGVNTACDDDPDPCTVGACCQSTGCTDETEGDCSDLGGTWVSGSLCADDPDPCSGACCILDIATPCQDLNEPDCDLEDGGFQGIDTVCPDDACIVGACCLDSTCEIETATGCSDLGGEFQGSGVDCTPDPCGATGACCDGDVCSEETEDDCVDLIGGIFLGADIPCDPNPCVCPAISMTCDSISAAKSKCGFSSGGKRFLTEISTTAASLARNFSVSNWNCNYLDEHGNVVILPSVSFTIVIDVSAFDVRHYEDLDCSALTRTCSQTGSVFSHSDILEQDSQCRNSCDSGSVALVDTGSCTFPSSTPPAPAYTISCDAFTCGVFIPNCGYQNLWNTSSPPTTTTFDAEYTTGMLKSHVESSLPPYSGSYTGGACASSRFLSSDEETYSIQRSKPRFSFATSPVDFSLTYDEVFTPAGGGSPSISSQSLSVSAGATFVDGPELFEPSSNGTTSIGNIRCTLL
jgi:hypothetical protein